MAVVFSGWLIAAVLAFMIVAYASFLGVAVIGLMIWFVTVRMDLEPDGAFVSQLVKTKWEMSRAERAARRSELSLQAQSTRFFRHFAMALTSIGVAGFLYFQLE